MKKMFFLLLSAGLFLTLVADGQSGSWIKTVDGQINCLKINVRGETVKVVLDNGEKTTFPASTVLSYFKEDKLYMKIPLYTNGIKGDMVFMEFMATRDDLSLYKYQDRYFVYKGDEIYLELIEGNKVGFEKYFNIQL